MVRGAEVHEFDATESQGAPAHHRAVNFDGQGEVGDLEQEVQRLPRLRRVGRGNHTAGGAEIDELADRVPPVAGEQGGDHGQDSRMRTMFP